MAVLTKGKDPGVSLRPTGKADNLESRGLSGFLKMSTVNFSGLRFYSFWHLLCLECLSHSVVFVDQMNDKSICL